MSERAVAVLDCGKTLAKLSLWRRDGALVAREARPNDRVEAGDYVALDAAGIERWVAATLRQFATLAEVGSIIPVSHGAAAAILRDGTLACPPLDYEEPIPASLRRDYDAWRDPFTDTGSPALPDGLNLGAQLFRLEALYPDLFGGDEIILPWAQYWSWLLSGVAASEVTSLGCHTDLWLPGAGTPSRLARARGWDGHLAPLARAGDVLGMLTPEWAARTGLPADVEIHCGLHDSNAALLAARAFPEIGEQDSTLLSTGTWFVAMRSPEAGFEVEMGQFQEVRDCLVNIDAFGQPVLSARFMGGREIETLIGLDTRRIDIKSDQPALLAAVPAVLAAGAMVLPTFAPGVGPFPHGRGRWINMPVEPSARRAAVSLYAALLADASLDLIGAGEHILIEGRFAEAEVFVRALATLRAGTNVYVGNAHDDVSFGALRLLLPDLAPQSTPTRVVPLDASLCGYRARWRLEAGRMEKAA